ncbi:MAG: hypothetical protein FJ218_03570 [Ignavibacteria bacterium]|nr:hypothetical protein [Ignavibacteria bacterium]
MQTTSSKHIPINKADYIFTTGAFLIPMKINIDGEYYWRWIVSEFVDDSFLYERMVNPIECTDKIETMLESIEDD